MGDVSIEVGNQVGSPDVMLILYENHEVKSRRARYPSLDPYSSRRAVSRLLQVNLQFSAKLSAHVHVPMVRKYASTFRTAYRGGGLAMFELT